MAEAAWDDIKVAFGIDDQEKLEAWMAETDDGEGILPLGWELNEVDTAGARCVAVFRTPDHPSINDGYIVRRILKDAGAISPT